VEEIPPAGPGRETPPASVASVESVADSAEFPDRNTVDDSTAPPVTSDAHSRLTRRMARLAQERNAGWRRILAAFSGAPASRTDN
jgi:hypothetical protein